MEDFILVSELVKKGKYSRNTLYVMHKIDSRKGRTDRFRKIAGKLWVHQDYPNIYKRDIAEVKDLYYKAVEYFENEYQMATYFYKDLKISHNAMYMYLREFRFWSNTRREQFRDLLKDFLQDRQINF